MNTEQFEQYKKDHCSRFEELMSELEVEDPEGMDEAHKWVKEFFENQEDLPSDMQKILEDNINDLYEE